MCEWRLHDCTFVSGGYTTIYVFVWRLHDYIICVLRLHDCTCVSGGHDSTCVCGGYMTLHV